MRRNEYEKSLIAHKYNIISMILKSISKTLRAYALTASVVAIAASLSLISIDDKSRRLLLSYLGLLFEAFAADLSL